MAWPEPELAVGLAAGVLRLPEELLLEDLLPDVPELDDLDEDEPDDFADRVPCAGAWDAEAAAPGRL